MSNRRFTMNGKVYESMMDMARELGVKRIYAKDFAKYGIEEVLAETNKADKADETNKADKAAETDKADKADKAAETNKADKKTGTPKQIRVLIATMESTPFSLDEFMDYTKHFTVEALASVAKTVGVNTWDTIVNQPIRRMRLMMGLRGHYFPTAKATTTKTASGWKPFKVETLKEIAQKNNVPFKVYQDERIQRMWITNALNKAGINPADYTQADAEGTQNA